MGQSQFESACDPMAPVMSFIDLDTGGLASVQGGATLIHRFLPGYASSENSSIIAGGLTCTGNQWTPTSRVDALSNGRIVTGELGAALIGATVTDLGSDTYLVWGYSIGDCGRSPGFLVQVSEDVKVRPLGGFDSTAGSTCAQPSSGQCRSWHATAFHTATRLDNAPDGSRRVLIVGGITGGNVLLNSLALPDSCGGNGSSCPSTQWANSDPVRRR